jgi:adenylate cyclase
MDVEQFRDALVAMGVDRHKVTGASVEQLVLLTIEHLTATGIPRYSDADMAEKAGLSLDEARRLWRALGLADPPPGERVFTQADVEALSTGVDLMRSGLADFELLLQMSRVLGSSLARVAEAQIGSALSRIREGGPLGMPATGGLLRMPELLTYVWQRQMQATARRRLDLVRDGDATPEVAVGFADLVGFTALSQQLSDRELAAVVNRFETLAFDTIAAAGGRVVKMIGDEVMFMAPNAATAAEIGLTLAETYRDDEELSDVRVGLSCGPALERDGDLYGPIVNLASRIVGIAYAGSVVVSDELHGTLEDDSRFEWRPLRRRSIKDIGRVKLWVLRRPGDTEGVLQGPMARARARREAVLERITDRLRPADVPAEADEPADDDDD